MTRTSKQGRRRRQSPRRPKIGAIKTGPKKDKLPQGFKQHENAITNELTQNTFIAKIK